MKQIRNVIGIILGFVFVLTVVVVGLVQLLVK